MNEFDKILLKRLETMETSQGEMLQLLVDLGNLVKHGDSSQHEALMKYVKIQTESTSGILARMGTLEKIVIQILERFENVEILAQNNATEFQLLKDQNQQILDSQKDTMKVIKGFEIPSTTKKSQTPRPDSDLNRQLGTQSSVNGESVGDIIVDQEITV